MENELSNLLPKILAHQEKATKSHYPFLFWMWVVWALLLLLGNCFVAVNRFIKEDRLPHLLLYGPPGTGKTSTILAVAKQIYSPKEFNSMVLEVIYLSFLVTSEPLAYILLGVSSYCEKNTYLMFWSNNFMCGSGCACSVCHYVCIMYMFS